jgi:hypothetical protein
VGNEAAYTKVLLYRVVCHMSLWKTCSTLTIDMRAEDWDHPVDQELDQDR